ncbi:hypothetical protein GCM10010435_48660 [Winogradskya consettensis]|uniref:DUF3618 domain-containing protein n=1 Tax=Winogradskya consettensis TaxID=113560 RepID=A0A919VXU3_9ACTN|nr:hypothetical protein [Actinoplanes consettensis]GIM73093.1 hypothetical protein Aco04nite_33590 [Actinoplanes consettensis]
MTANETIDTRTPEEIRTDIERTRTDLTRPLRMITTARTTAAELPGRARQAGRTAGDHWMATAAATMAVAAAVTALILQRRRAATQARELAARSTWRRGFRNR